MTATYATPIPAALIILLFGLLLALCLGGLLAGSRCERCNRHTDDGNCDCENNNKEINS